MWVCLLGGLGGVHVQEWGVQGMVCDVLMACYVHVVR